MTKGAGDSQTLLKLLMQAGDKTKTVALLSELAVASARRGAYELAENYRDRLYEADSAALDAIIKVNDIIEQEKAKARQPARRRLWQHFFENFRLNEANAFFMSLKKMDMVADQVILSQGSVNDRLFMVNKGRLKVVHEKKDKELLLQHIESGDSFGEDTFFSVNVCTASVVCLSPGQLMYLEQPRYFRLKRKFPDLEVKLTKVCAVAEPLSALLRKKGLDRRAHERINLQAKVKVQVLTPHAANTLHKPFTADLWDISLNGLSFYMQSKNKAAVRRLIGRTLGVRVVLHVGGATKEAALTGVVHGVQNHPLDEYSVHLRLTRAFSAKTIHVLKMVSTMQQ